MQPNFYMQVKEEIKIEEQDLSGLVKIEDEASSESTYEQAANAAQVNQHYCSICSICFINKSNFNIHLNECHAEVGKIKIEEQDLFVRVKTEDEASSNLSSSETAHEQAANAAQINNQHSCNICSRCFINKSKLNMHLNECHAQGGKITAEEEELPVLIKTEDELTSNLSSTQTTDPQAARTKLKKYKCNFCWAFFADKSNLDVHLARHSENHPFECDICGLKFKRIRQLTIHHNTHTKKRQFNCDICNKTFVLHSELFFHMKTHSDQRPYACDICSSKFKKRYQLVKHRNNHMILTEYTCSICDKTFVIERFYKDHLKTHSEEGPLQCDICNIQFKLKDTLLQHCRAVHSEPAI
ncbi:zinc finger protein 12-like [Dendroctonus ponderosae]|uniref:zinc finger protein 12-like n=1 Tax=Dendroctonus ponderosae TaxID=77166 RepID=UPI0020351459|nr:zinc finger protein 12-like [Dendroctonus ponderosae]